MGFLDTLKKVFAGGGGAESDTALMAIIVQLISDKKAGGLPGLLKLLKDNGLAEQVESWVGTGENLPVSADQIKKALGGQIAEYATQLGKSEDDVAGKLAGLLPVAIDKLTMFGQIPEGDVLASRLNILKGDAAW